MSNFRGETIKERREGQVKVQSKAKGPEGEISCARAHECAMQSQRRKGRELAGGSEQSCNSKPKNRAAGTRCASGRGAGIDEELLDRSIALIDLTLSARRAGG